MGLARGGLGGCGHRRGGRRQGGVLGGEGRAGDGGGDRGSGGAECRAPRNPEGGAGLPAQAGGGPDRSGRANHRGCTHGHRASSRHDDRDRRQTRKGCAHPLYGRRGGQSARRRNALRRGGFSSRHSRARRGARADAPLRRADRARKGALRSDAVAQQQPQVPARIGGVGVVARARKAAGAHQAAHRQARQGPTARSPQRSVGSRCQT